MRLGSTLLMTGAVLLLSTSVLMAADADRDGIDDTVDNCPYYYNPAQLDFDDDGIGDACDSCSDLDGDGYGHPSYPLIDCPPDNCPCFFNPDQADSNLDGIGDACDEFECADINTDGTPNEPWDVFFLWNFFSHRGPAPCITTTADLDSCTGFNIADATYAICWATAGCNEYTPACSTRECAPVLGGGSVAVNQIDGLTRPDTIITGQSLTYHIRYVATEKVWGFTNSFRVFGSVGIDWEWIDFNSSLLDPGDQHFDGARALYGRGLTGSEADTVVLGASINSYSGFPPGYDDEVLTISIGPITSDVGEGEICLDSCSIPPHGQWLWGAGPGSTPPEAMIPSWSGPHCITVLHCCQIRGDMDYNGSDPDIADLIYMVTYMFQEGPAPVCISTTDINGDELPEPDIADLIYLVTFMFQDGPAPALCPQ